MNFVGWYGVLKKEEVMDAYQASVLGAMIGVAFALLWGALESKKSEQCLIAFLFVLQGLLLFGLFLKD